MLIAQASKQLSNCQSTVGKTGLQRTGSMSIYIIFCMRAKWTMFYEMEMVYSLLMLAKHVKVDVLLYIPC